MAQEPPAAPPAAQTGNVTPYQPGFFSQFRPNTAMDMIGRIPGFSFDGGSGARGFEGTGGNVLIDGERPPSRGDSLSSVLSRIPASAVLRIDVIRGGADGIDMQGKPIVANVIRKPDGGITGAVTTGISGNDRGDPNWNAGLQAQNQKGGTLLEGSVSYNTSKSSGDELRKRINPQGVTILEGDTESESDYEYGQVTGAYETALLGGKIRVNGQASHQNNGYDSLETQTIPTGGSQVSGSDNEQTAGEAGLRYTRNFGDYGLELVGFQSMRHSENTSIFNTSAFTSGNQSESDSGESIARSTLRLPKFDNLTIDMGLEAAYNFTESQSARILDGGGVALQGDKFEANELRTQAFSALTWAPSAKLSAELGARYEWSTIEATVGTARSEKSLGFFKPRLNVSWTPQTGHQLGLRIERTVEQLSFGGFASSAQFETQVFGIGNPDIEPEKAWVVDARYERRFGGQNVFVAQLIHREIEDVLGRTIVEVLTGPPPGTPQLFEITRNVGEARRDSLDLKGTFELDKFGMKGGLVNFGVTFRDSETRDPVTGEMRKMSGDTPMSWNFNIQQTLANGAFRWAIFVEDDEDYYSYSPRLVSKNEQEMFIGGNITWKPWSGWSFGAGINNWLRPTYELYGVFHDKPRGPVFGGKPVYLEKFESTGARTFFVNLRRNF